MESQARARIRRAELLALPARSLITQLNAELGSRYPEEGSNHFDLDAHEVVEGRGAFFIAYLNDEPVGCGAVRLLSRAVAEFKRMYVAPSARNRGIGRRLLDELEHVARKLGASRIVLETGVRQPEAIALYTRAGFHQIPVFGDYANSPHPELSFCMAKDL